MGRITVDVPNLLPDPVQRIIVDVLRERGSQNMTHGQQDHSPELWLSILGEEFGEVCREVCDCTLSEKSWKENYRAELVQLAAVAIQMIECFDRSQVVGSNSEQTTDENNDLHPASPVCK